MGRRHADCQTLATREDETILPWHPFGHSRRQASRSASTALKWLLKTYNRIVTIASAWMCPECFAVLGTPGMERAAALAEWLKHAGGRHAARWAMIHGVQLKTPPPSISRTLRRPAGSAEKSVPVSPAEAGPVERRLVTCPCCGAPLRADRVQGHIAKLHVNELAMSKTSAAESLVHARRILFVKFRWPGWGLSRSFRTRCCIGIALRRTEIHLLAAFPNRNGEVDYIWFERPKGRSRVFWDTIYTAPVKQLASTNKERLRTWNRLRESWDEICTRSYTGTPPVESGVDTALLLRFAVPPPPPAETRKPHKERLASRKPRMFVQGGIPGLGRR
jgi:hypothetical protein